MSGVPFAPNDDDIRLGKTLQNVRFQMGLSQKDVAKKIGVSFQQIQKYETADNRVSVSRLIQIARALDVTVSQLLGETAAPHAHDPKMADMISRMYMMSPARRELVYELVNILTNYARPQCSKKKHKITAHRTL